jgi:hypothetical protein
VGYQVFSVIVNDHREQARSYNESSSRRFLDSPVGVIFVIVLGKDNAPSVAVFNACAKLNGVLNRRAFKCRPVRPKEAHDMNLARAASVRKEFYKAVWFYFKVVWPIFSILLLVIIAIGLIIAQLEGWSPDDGVYFAFVTGLTIGYGELVPKLGVSRVLAIVLGFNGVLMTATFAAISVRAIEVTVTAARKDV